MHLLTLITTLSASAHFAASQTTIIITPSLPLQQIDGLASLPLPARQLSLDYLFGTSTSAGLTVIRNRIGSGGSGDSILPASPGTNTSTPSYVWDGVDAGQVWFSREAMSYGVKTIYADAWSAPGFMKTTGTDSIGGYLYEVTGESCTYDWRVAYANFLVQYVKFSASFIPFLYSALKSSGYSNVSLTCCDAEGWTSQATMTAEPVSAGMEAYLSIITSHMYTSNPTTPIATSLKTWQSEGADLNDAFCTTWYSSRGACEGLTWASKISTGIVNANLSAYLYWEGVEQDATTSSSHLIDTDGTNVTPSGRFWALAMWSWWVSPGARRLTSSGTVTGVAYGAFKNVDGTIAVVFTNTVSTAQSVSVAFGGFAATTASVWLTDNTHTMNSTTATVPGGSVSLSVPAYPVITVQMSGDLVAVSSGSSVVSTSTSSVLKTSSVNGTSLSSLSITATTTKAAATGTQSEWGQCGESGWTGPTACVSPYACSMQNAWIGWYSTRENGA
ncbi:glycoside hydrolase [Acephala macrosclerotiorum]|nr:glycoside hydrolase [Acephala macrosclerotiorum]